MKIIILSGKANKPLNWITRGEAVGSLQLVNKPIINFTLDALQQQLKLSQFQILGGSRSKKLIDKVGKQLNWETNIQDYLDDSTDNLEEVLWLRDDVLYDVDFNKILQQAQQITSKSVVFFSNNNPVIFYQKNSCWNEPPVFFSEHNSTDNFCHTLLNTISWHSEQLANDASYLIDSVENYYRYSMDLLNGSFKTIILDYHQQGSSLVKGVHVNMEASSQQQQHAYLGDFVYIHPKSQLHEQVILCQQSYVDSCVDISDSIVLPGVYIGSYLNINHAVVTQDAVIRVDTGSVLPIVDKNILFGVVL